MPSIPRGICIPCKRSMRIHKSGAILEMMRPGQDIHGKPLSYYKVMADIHKCPDCGTEAAVAFGAAPIAEHFQDDYANVPAEMQID